MLRCGEGGIAVVNVWSLSALGTYKKMVVDKIQTVLTAMPGMTIVLLPHIASCTFRKLGKKQSMGRPGKELPEAGPSEGEEGPEPPASGGEEDHDYDEQGCLPDSITKAYSRLAPKLLAMHHHSRPRSPCKTLRALVLQLRIIA